MNALQYIINMTFLISNLDEFDKNVNLKLKWNTRPLRNNQNRIRPSKKKLDRDPDST